MDAFSDPLAVECGAACGNACEQPTGNVQPLLHEIRHAVDAWLQQGERNIIDLRSLPMSAAEEEQLLEALGTGEVRARVQALGPTDVIETRYPGVWVVVHYNADDEVLGRFIEVCDIPALLLAQREDVESGLQQLDAQLA